jgi:hypothetical protein
MKDQNELESIVMQRLDEIKPVPPRNPHMASRGRAQFLSQAVSAGSLPRQKGWKSIFRKEQYAMNVLFSILVIAGLLFGGGATAVGAAQDDLPSEPLYAVKMWAEDLTLQFQYNEEAKVDRLMELAQIRIQEMTRLVDAGEPIPDQVMLRLEQHIQQALQLCVNMDDPTLERTLLQIRDRLRVQVRDMEQLHLQTQDELQVQTKTRTMLQERIQLVEEGLLNHEIFQNQVQNAFQYGQDDEMTPPVQDGNGEQIGQPNTEPGGNNVDPGSTPNNNGGNGSGGGGKP